MEDVLHETVPCTDDLGFSFTVDYDKNGLYCPMHWHEELEIIYIFEKSLYVTVEQEKRLLREGDFIVINSHAFHDSLCKSGNTMLMMQFPYRFLKQYIPDVQQIAFCCDCRQEHPCIHRMKEIFVKLAKVYEEKKNGYLFVFHRLVLELLELLYHHFSVPGRTGIPGRPHIERLNQMVRYLHIHHAEDVKLSHLAEQLYLSPEYTARFFKKYMGCSVMQYLAQIRLEYIYDDILHTDDTIRVLLHRHHFHNYKLFTKLFIEKYHQSPCQVKKQRGQNLPKKIS